MLDVPFVRVSREPKIFSCFPDIKSDLVIYCNDKISEGCMSTELVLSELKNIIIPKHFDIHIEEQKTNNQIILDYDMILHALQLQNISYSTVWRWLSHIGYKYDINNKSYYTDGHERADVVDDRNNRFLIHYYKYEQQCYRWIQITETEAVQFEKEDDNFPKNCYFEYVKEEITWREYHVDTNVGLLRFLDADGRRYGGNLSVRATVGSKPLMLIGQDESTFYQLVFAKKQWKGPKGKNFIQPKGVGEILMLSGFQAREFGLGLGTLLTENKLHEINKKRCGTKYQSATDAMLINGTDAKSDITDDPLLRYFRAGVNREGYWNCSHMKIQLEDAIDCLETVFPQFDFVFLFDQSSGHTKMQNDGLVVSNMNVSYGSAIAKMHDSNIEEVGEYAGLLKVGDTQTM